MAQQTNDDSLREPAVGDPKQYIADFELWMATKEVSWLTLGIIHILQYKNYLFHELDLTTLETIIRTRVIANKFGQVIHRDARPTEMDEMNLLIRFGYDLDKFMVHGPKMLDLLYETMKNEGFRAALIRLTTEQKRELESGTYGPLVKYASSSEKVAILMDFMTRILETDGRVRLTSTEALDLLTQPGIDTPQGLRDTATVALLLCTGVREAELQALDVADLHFRLQGMPALHVPSGSGCTERLIPYGEMLWVLDIVDAWLRTAGISDGPVLRGFYRNNASIRPSRLGLRSIRDILAKYPVKNDSPFPERDQPETFVVTPLDLRRTYANFLYSAGMDLGAIAANLGVADIKTVLEYIGKIQVLEQFPPSLYEFDTSQLKKTPPEEKIMR